MNSFQYLSSLEYIGAALSLLGGGLYLLFGIYRLFKKIGGQKLSRQELVRDAIPVGLFGFMMGLGLLIFEHAINFTRTSSPLLSDLPLIICIDLSCLAFFILLTVLVYVLGMIRYGYVDLKPGDEQER